MSTATSAPAFVAGPSFMRLARCAQRGGGLGSDGRAIGLLCEMETVLFEKLGGSRKCAK